MIHFLTVLSWVLGVLAILYTLFGFCATMASYGPMLTRDGKALLVGRLIGKLIPAMILIVVCVCWILTHL